MMDIRPPLKDIAPLSYWNTKGFGVFNILCMGIGLYLLAPNIQSFQTIGALPIRFWAVVFFLHGLALFAASYKNHWQRMKRLLLVGCMLKLAWVLQFASMSIQHPTPLTLSFMSIGILLLYIQAGTYINFTPKYHVE